MPFILLVNPWIYDFAAYDLWIRPVGLLSIASLLIKSGCEVHLIDCLDSYHPGMHEYSDKRTLQYRKSGQGRFFKQNIPKPACLHDIPRNYSRYGMFPHVFQKELESLPQPDAVLVGSMMTYWYPAVIDCIKIVKQVLPGVPVMLGGVYATLCHDHATIFSGADHIVRGPFNGSIIKKLELIIQKPLLAADYNTVPCPAWELLTSKKVIPLLTSRGCPLQCPYCASRLLWPDFFQREPLTVADEIERCHLTYGTTNFSFYDDALLINSDTHIIPLLESVLERGLQVQFHVPNGLHVRSLEPRIADLMQWAGFKTLRLGLESSDEIFQKKTGNKASCDDFTRAVKALQTAGYTDREVGVYILAGLPGQSVKSVRDSIAFVQEHSLRPYLTEYSPIPGTVLWEKAVACSPFPIAHEPLFHNNTLLPCRSPSFTIDDLEKLKRESRNNITYAE